LLTLLKTISQQYRFLNIESLLPITPSYKFVIDISKVLVFDVDACLVECAVNVEVSSVRVITRLRSTFCIYLATVT